MLVVICGPSGSGKSTLAKKLTDIRNFNYYEGNPFTEVSEVVMTTTRAPREGEKDGVDYHFLSLGDFKDLIKKDELIYFEEYSGQRFYGVTKDEVQKYLEDVEKLGVLVTTPQGLRRIQEMVRILDRENGMDSKYYHNNFYSCLINVSLGERVKRYIDRIGTDKFNYSDMSEISARVNRDFGMFLGVEEEVDLILENEKEQDLSLNVSKIADELYDQLDWFKQNGYSDSFSFHQDEPELT